MTVTQEEYDRLKRILFQERDENNRRVKELESQIKFKDRQLVELAYDKAEHQAEKGMAEQRFKQLQERIDRLEGTTP